MPYPFADMTLYFFLYSFFGWLLETVQHTVKQRRFVNRGFLNGPICPIYGCGVLVMLLFLGPVRDGVHPPALALLLIFVGGSLVASAIEYATSWAMEKLFHARWWDYSRQPLNLNGRICLWISLAWGGLAVVLLLSVQPRLEMLVHMLYTGNARLPLILACGLLALLAADCAVSVRVALAVGNKLEQLDRLGDLIREHLEGIRLPSAAEAERRLSAAYERYNARRREKVAELQLRSTEWRALSQEEKRRRIADKAAELQKKRGELLHTQALQRRLLSAFPGMKRAAGSTSLGELREHLRRRRESRHRTQTGKKDK